MVTFLVNYFQGCILARLNMDSQKQISRAQRTIRIAHIVLFMVWFYHGLIPKIIFSDTGELEMLKLSGIFNGIEKMVLTSIGIAEIIFAFFILFVRRKFVHYLNIIALFVLAVGAGITDPASYTMPFNPFSLNLSLIAISAIALINFESTEAPFNI